MCVREAASHADNAALSSFLWLEEAIVQASGIRPTVGSRWLR